MWSVRGGGCGQTIETFPSQPRQSISQKTGKMSTAETKKNKKKNRTEQNRTERNNRRCRRVTIATPRNLNLRTASSVINLSLPSPLVTTHGSTTPGNDSNSNSNSDGKRSQNTHVFALRPSSSGWCAALGTRRWPTRSRLSSPEQLTLYLVPDPWARLSPRYPRTLSLVTTWSVTSRACGEGGRYARSQRGDSGGDTDHLAKRSKLNLE